MKGYEIFKDIGFGEIKNQNTFNDLKNDSLIDFVLYAYLNKNKSNFKDLLLNKFNIFDNIKENIVDCENFIKSIKKSNPCFIREQALKFKEDKEVEVSLEEFVELYNWLTLNKINYFMVFKKDQSCYLKINSSMMTCNMKLKISGSSVIIRSIEIKDYKREKCPEELLTGNLLLDSFKKNLRNEIMMYKINENENEKSKINYKSSNWLLGASVFENKDDCLILNEIRIKSLLKFESNSLDSSFKFNEDNNEITKNELIKLNNLIEESGFHFNEEEYIIFAYLYIYKKENLMKIIEDIKETGENVNPDNILTFIDINMPFYSVVRDEINNLKKEVNKIKKIKSVDDLLNLII
jgi:hypothetical protein